MEKLTKRPLKEQNEVRELALSELEKVVLTNHKHIGRTQEGLVFQDSEGRSIVVKVIVKSLEFDGEFECTEYENEQSRKVIEKAEKEAKKKKAIEKKAEKAVKEATKKE